MLKELNEIFQPFVQKGAVSVMARAALECLLLPTGIVASLDHLERAAP
jgi:hypothetical protein